MADAPKKNWFAKNYGWVIAAVAAIAIATLLLKDKIKEAFTKPSENPEDAGSFASSSASAPATSGTATSESFPLKMGSKGDLVKNLQAYLNYSGSYGLTVDGIFGPKTESACVAEFSGLVGVANPKEVTKQYYDSFIAPWLQSQSQIPSFSSILFGL